MVYNGERQRVMYSINIISGVEINFFDNLPPGKFYQMSTCPR